MELSDNILKKDVQQIAVSFSDHRIYSPAPSESETREGLKTCLFQGLATNALQHIVQLRLASHRLQNRHRMLHARLRQYQQKSGEADSMTQRFEETGRELEKIEAEMMNTPLLTPQVILEQVLDVFSKPENFVQLRKLSLRLNKMGIKISDTSPEPANRLDLTEVIIGNEAPRVITLATFPRKELLARTVFTGSGQIQA
jgi:hypothetical protein